MTDDLLSRLVDRLDTSRPDLDRLDAYAEGRQPLAFLAPEARTALRDRLRVLSVNFPRLAVMSLAERLSVNGFRLRGPDDDPDRDLSRIWTANNMDDGSHRAHVEALTHGRAFAMVWAGRGRSTPRVTVESARQVVVERDPETGEVTSALKAWSDPVQRKAFATVLTPLHATRYVHDVADAALLPRDGWSTRDEKDNPLGVVPVVPLVNTGRLLDVDGRSEMADVLDLADALNKTLADAMVTSEAYARPRRWATGLEVVEDDDGNPVNPFSDEALRLWQAEDPAARFGEFSQANLAAYSALVAMLTQQIGALSGLPPHYLGLNGDQPASADAIRSAEASLVARAIAKQRTFGRAWADVARLVVAVRDGTDPAALDDATVIWGSPETRTPAQAADAAAKLAGIGVPLSTLLTDTLGMTPPQVDRVMAARRAEGIDKAGVDLSKVLAP